MSKTYAISSMHLKGAKPLSVTRTTLMSVGPVTPAALKQRSCCAGFSRLRNDRGLYGADHDQETDARFGPDYCAHDLRPLRRGRPWPGRHGPRVDEVVDVHSSAADVRHHLLRPDDRRRI